MRSNSISYSGFAAEYKLVSLVSNSEKVKGNSRQGDVRVKINKKWYYLEVKSAISDTINQVRAIKYLPLVVFCGDKCNYQWLVIPPQDIVAFVSEKSRGQHTEICFESANLSKNKILQYGDRYGCYDGNLEDYIMEAILSGEDNQDVKELMMELEDRLRDLGNEIKGRM